MPDEAIIQEAARWLRYAKEDYETANKLRLSGPPRHSCMLAQQSAEKAIKSIYAFLDMRITKSHDLDMLKQMLPEGWDIKTRFTDLSELSFWAVESRYPGDMPEATQEDADSAVILAQDVLTVIERNLRENGLSE